MNNAQLIKTLAKKRTANFREDETRLLISLWGSPQIQNKLNLTHRKAPVMRLIAANMQQRGFYRSPDEIKTRIRNLKCLYHRIKRTITSGSGIGTVDPDWPHFKAMDAILGDSSSNSSKMPAKHTIKADLDAEGSEHFEIKQEIDINDDLDSWNENDSNASDYEDDLTAASLPEPAITLTTGPPAKVNTITSNTHTINISNMGQAGNQILQPTRTITCAPQQLRGNQQQNVQLPSSIPLPFLILNSLKPAGNQVNNQQQVLNQLLGTADGGPPPNKKKRDSYDESSVGPALNQLLDVQRQILDVDKQRLDVEKQRLEFDRLVGSQLMTLVPMIGTLIQRLIFPQQNDGMDKDFDMDHNRDDDMSDLHPPDHHLVPSERPERDLSNAEDELEKNRNILRNLLNEGLKARMLKEQQEKEAGEEATTSIEVVERTNEAAKESEKLDEPVKDTCATDKDVDMDKGSEEAEDIEDDAESCVLLINENSNETNEDN